MGKGGKTAPNGGQRRAPQTAPKSSPASPKARADEAGALPTQRSYPDHPQAPGFGKSGARGPGHRGGRRGAPARVPREVELAVVATLLNTNGPTDLPTETSAMPLIEQRVVMSRVIVGWE